LAPLKGKLIFDVRKQNKREKTYVKNYVRVAIVELAILIFRPVAHLEFLKKVHITY